MFSSKKATAHVHSQSSPSSSGSNAAINQHTSSLSSIFETIPLRAFHDIASATGLAAGADLAHPFRFVEGILAPRFRIPTSIETWHAIKNLAPSPAPTRGSPREAPCFPLLFKSEGGMGGPSSPRGAAAAAARGPPRFPAGCGPPLAIFPALSFLPARRGSAVRGALPTTLCGGGAWESVQLDLTVP